jgi:hypothetical protein
VPQAAGAPSGKPDNLKAPRRPKRGPSDRSGAMFRALPLFLQRQVAAFVSDPRALAAFGLACHSFLAGVKSLPPWHGNLLDSNDHLHGVSVSPCHRVTVSPCHCVIVPGAGVGSVVPLVHTAR